MKQVFVIRTDGTIEDVDYVIHSDADAPLRLELNFPQECELRSGDVLVIKDIPDAP